MPVLCRMQARETVRSRLSSAHSLYSSLSSVRRSRTFVSREVCLFQVDGRLARWRSLAGCVVERVFMDTIQERDALDEDDLPRRRTRK